MARSADDITRQVADLAGSIEKLQAERQECLKEAEALEAEARRLRLRASACKQESAGAQVALTNLQVRQRVVSHETAAAAARAAATAELEEARRVRAEVEELLAKIKTTAPPTDAKPE